jgi:pyruvate/2-oxoglutarate dehydrogenase complex dihydrolipoamide dehydrogenase (E3) component
VLRTADGMMSAKKGEGIYNVVVIGGGTAGLVTAAGTAALGGRVALIERGKMGGECLNTGCVPSKAILSSARLASRIRNARVWGLDAQEPKLDFLRVMMRMREQRAQIAPHDSRERFESLGVDVFAGQARFVSPREVEVAGHRLRARNFVIATGSRPAVPPIDGLDRVRYFTNETIFDELRERPQRMLVLGGGPVGAELAQAFARLGILVTLLERGPRILLSEDADASGLVQQSLERDGVRVITGADTQLVVQHGSLLRVWAEAEGRDREPIDCEVILVATGRLPNTEELELEKASVAFTADGITVNEKLQTSQRHIYAAGDVLGPPNFTHLADLHARTIVRNLLTPWWPQKVDTSALPACTYTSPEVARVGANEQDAVRRGVPYDVFQQPMDSLDRAVVESETTGFAKVLTVKGKDEILGATIVCERAGEIIHELVLAMTARLGLSAIGRTIHAYPSFSEILRQIADQKQRTRLTPFRKKILAALYRRART